MSKKPNKPSHTAALSAQDAFTDACAQRWHNRYTMTTDEWIENHASGTLRKNKKLGMNWHSQYLEERVAFEYGFGFEPVPANRVTVGTAISFGDCPASTETGWHTDRAQTQDLFGDKPKPAYIHIEHPDQTRVEGIGIVLNITNRPEWLPKNYVVCAIVAVYDPLKKHYLEPRNPF